ncbi:MAG TPA: mycothiol synthase [Mycobacteriales bacterium]|nr:mycothiol synthase [Mycobacteriales bacterium]
MESLSAEEADAVLRLRDTVMAADGFSPLSDPVVASLRRREPGTHLTQHRAGQLVGYAHIDRSGEHPAAELVVAPGVDPRGLLSVVVDTAGPGVRIWTKGEAAPLNDVLPSLGFTLERTLLKLHRSLDDPLPAPVWAPGVSVRTFVVGTDEAAWLAVNNAAFVGHPEQADWTLADIEGREQEPWFDPAGFFLAELDGSLAGFHWTKVHAGSKPYGEVYVIGVAPGMQGKRLGEALLLHGLRHLRDQGLRTVVLYVEADNSAAIALYERLGFTRWSADRLFASPPAPTPTKPAKPATAGSK